MSVWEALQAAIRDLADSDTRPLLGFPDPNGPGLHEPPYSIWLAAWATGVAADLHDTFGASVELRVGAMSYPNLEPVRGSGFKDYVLPPAETAGLQVDLVEPIRVRSGHSVTAPVWVTNLTDETRVLSSNGVLQSRIVRGDGETVGITGGAQTLAGHDFTVEPRDRVQIPVILGTTSVVPSLGYSVPPGDWLLEVRLEVASDPTDDRVRSYATYGATLPMTITGPDD